MKSFLFTKHRASATLQSKCHHYQKAADLFGIFNMAAAFALLWEYFRDHPPSLLIGSLEFILGFLTFLSMFHGFTNIVAVLKLKNGQILSYADNVSLSCKTVSAIFACVSCMTGVVSKFYFKNVLLFEQFWNLLILSYFTLLHSTLVIQCLYSKAFWESISIFNVF